MCQKCDDYMDKVPHSELEGVYDQALNTLAKIMETHATNPFVGGIVKHTEMTVDKLNAEAMIKTALLGQEGDMEIADEISLIRRESYLAVFFAGVFAAQRGVDLEVYACDDHHHGHHVHNGTSKLKDLNTEDFGEQNMN